jgi:DNA-binding transcriptional ArsR family regulator
MAPAWACRRKKQTEDELEGKSWLSDLLSGTTMGKRNESCARIAGYFLKKRIPEDIVQAIMLGWNRRNAEPLEEVEIHKTVRSIYSGKRIGDFAPDARGPWLEALHTFGAKFGDKAIHWLVEGWLPDASIAFCVSPPGSYKTWLVLELAIAVATNTKFLNIAEIHNPGPVLIFQQEDANSMIVDRIALLLASRYETGFSVKDETISISLPARAPIWIHTQRGLHFNDADSLYQLADEIRDKEARLVVIDPLYMAAGSSDGYMQETAQQMAVLKDLRDRYATTFMVVHHTRKTSSGSGGRLDTWGSQFLNAFLETGWQVRPVEYQKKEGGSQMLVPTSGVEVYRHFKSGASDLSSIYLSWNITDSGVEVEVAENVDIINRIEGEKRTSDISILALVVTPNNTMTIARQCKLSPSQTSRRLQRLVTAGLVVKMQDGRWMLSLQGVSKLENNGTSGDDLL